MIIPENEYTAAYSNNINAGTGRVTITDIAGGNYDIAETSQDFEIRKATAPTAKADALTITNGLVRTYSFDLSALLPKLTAPCNYGTAAYGKPDTALGEGTFVTKVNSKTGMLTLEVSNRSSKDEGQFGTITVTVTTDNYQDIVLTINVSVENRISPQADGAVTATDITYGQTLNDSVITGRMKDGGKTLKDAALTTDGSTLNPNAGRLEWVDNDGNVLPGNTRVEANRTYKWRFTPADSNYTSLTGEIELYHVASSGGGTTSTVTVPVSSDQNTVRVDATVSGSTASVKITDRQLDHVISGGERVTVDVSGLKNVSAAKLPSSVVGKMEQSGTELTVCLPTGSVSLDIRALGSIRNTGDMTISVRQATLTNAQREAVGTLAQVAAAVDADVTVGAVKQTSFGGGQLTISIPYAPKSGEDVSGLAVWFIRDDGSIEDMGGHYDAKTGCFVFQTDHLSRCLLVNTAAAQQFADVPAAAYFAGAVAWAQENGITNGISSSLFGVNDPCTRAQAVTFLWRSEKSPAAESSNPFADVASNAYYADAVLWAVKEEITKGTAGNTFSPDADCTRAQIVTFLWRCKT